MRIAAADDVLQNYPVCSVRSNGEGGSCLLLSYKDIGRCRGAGSRKTTRGNRLTSLVVRMKLGTQSTRHVTGKDAKETW
jgi:hypothetical protein